MTTTRIGLLLFPRMTQLDLTGPFEVFAKMPGAEVLLLWKTLEPVEAETGLRMLPNATLRDCPPLDVVCVPGGPGVSALMEDDEVLAWLRERMKSRGAASLHRCAGAGRRGVATRVPDIGSHDLLAALGAIPTRRGVRDGDLLRVV
jgi:cyclohexyl-isocyanide hydratase